MYFNQLKQTEYGLFMTYLTKCNSNYVCICQDTSDKALCPQIQTCSHNLPLAIDL